MRGNTRAIIVDAVLAAVLTAVTVSSTAYQRPDAGVLTIALVLLTSAPIVLRQVAPVATLGVVLAAQLALAVLVGNSYPEGGFAVLIATFTVATQCSRRVVLLTFGATFAVVVGTVVAMAGHSIPTPVLWSELLKGLLGIIVAGVLGESVKRRAEHTERLAARAERAAADERVRIARELHDVVAHHMSVISLQAGVSRYLLDTDRPAARTALACVEEASHDALSELRRLLEVLRPADSPGADYEPQPGLASLDGLVERTRAAGVPVEVAVSGEVRPLPPGPDLCAYRVVQESLTNVIKHAGSAGVRIAVDYGENTLTLRVLDDGAQPAAGGVPGYGIKGMRERTELYGGVLTAGPRDEGGFGVTARLPL
ncbi:sensor histidine kinase [Cryptosporangium arvum]|uniref:sensor histidine kinase n=1 Tax=Cryptosporangium arvum TaxID=80871 RepID=UPI0004B22E4E|nr:sensor histidine kinase [Cryptosporangium arvum]